VDARAHVLGHLQHHAQEGAGLGVGRGAVAAGSGFTEGGEMCGVEL
jgi:hypothetical protein